MKFDKEFKKCRVCGVTFNMDVDNSGKCTKHRKIINTAQDVKRNLCRYNHNPMSNPYYGDYDLDSDDFSPCGFPWEYDGPDCV